MLTINDAACSWRVTRNRQIEISGPDAFTFTNMMTPRDLNKCSVRQAQYEFITLPDGGIATDPVLRWLEENRFWLSLADSDMGLWAQGRSSTQTRRSPSGDRTGPLLAGPAGHRRPARGAALRGDSTRRDPGSGWRLCCPRRRR